LTVKFNLPSALFNVVKIGFAVAKIKVTVNSALGISQASEVARWKRINLSRFDPTASDGM
jgi:hypothetical protein